MTNALTDPRTSERVAKFQAAFAEASVAIEHTGGGCHWLAVRFGEGRDFYVLTEGEAFLPEPDEGWRYLGLQNDDDASPNYEGTQLRWLGGEAPGFSDEEAIEAIRRREALAVRLAETYGSDPQLVGAEDGTEDDFGDLIGEAVSGLGYDALYETDEAHWERAMSAATDSEATDIRTWLGELEAVLAARP